MADTTPADHTPSVSLISLVDQERRSASLPTPLSTFVGRARELANIVELLRQPDVRQVTLTGPGGVGKTRLALAVAEALRASFGDGVAYISLAAIRDPDLVMPTVARALGIREVGARPIEDGLAAALRRRHLLLILDNFEQVIDAAPSLVALLSDCRDLKALVTSRAVLRASGEHTYAVTPLALPGQEHQSLPDLAGVEAVNLFVARARAVDPNFQLTEANAAAVTEVCRRLEGLPLAIELAAARVRVLEPQPMVTRLERRLPLLTAGARDLPERQRTMRGAIAWSHDLLSAEEQALFRRLAVFVGGFTLDAAAAVAAAGLRAEESEPRHIDSQSPFHNPEPFDLVAALEEQSLLRPDGDHDGEPWFVMLETIREFAAERLAASDEETWVRSAHADHFLAWAQEAEIGLLGPDQLLWQRRLEAEHANLRAALAWGLERDPGMALRLATALWRFWWSHIAEGRAWLERTLVRAPDAPVPLRVKALGAASILASFGGDVERGATWARKTITLAEQSGDEAGRTWGLLNLSFADRCRRDHVSAAAHAEAAVLTADLLENDWWSAYLQAISLNRLGHEAYELGNWPRAEAVLAEALDRWRRLGYPWGSGVALAKLADVAQAQGDKPRAAALYAESLGYWPVLQNELSALEVLTGIARLVVRNDPARAVTLFAAVAAIQERAAIVPAPALRAQNEAALTAARDALDEEAFATAWATGQHLGPAEVEAEARSTARDFRTSPHPSSAPRPAPAPLGLTPRELEVLRLVAAGQTDRQIAESLFLSPRTVNHHVSSALAKLDVGSRTAAVIAAQAAGLLLPLPSTAS